LYVSCSEEKKLKQNTERWEENGDGSWGGGGEERNAKDYRTARLVMYTTDGVFS
jgi:hypothetical protein